MRGNRRRDAGPEIRIRRALHGAGLRYRVDLPVVTPTGRVRVDVAFTRSNVAVFVDGCYWHGCPRHGTQPRANSEYWRAKLERNQERDQRNDRGLAEAGWRVVRIWEHEDSAQAIARIADALGFRGG